MITILSEGTIVIIIITIYAEYSRKDIRVEKKWIILANNGIYTL